MLPSRLSYLLLLFLILLSLLPLGCSVGVNAGTSTLQKEATAQSTGVVPANFFGMVVRVPGTSPAVQAGARRLWDSGVTWAALEPAPGSFDWSTLDGEVAAARAAGAEVTLTLGMTPTWASSQPSLASAYGAGATAMPSSLADWDGYVSAVVNRYRGQIAGYEVWNAPENPAYFTDQPSQAAGDIASLAQHTASIVHGADPSAVVVSPAFSSQGLAAFITAGGGAAVDVLGSSLNGDGSGGAAVPESMAANLQALRAVISGTSADGKPVWNDQSSWTLAPGDLSPQTQAAYVARALLLNAGLGIQRLHWYAWDETGASTLSLSDAQGQPTEAAVAYNAVQGWLTGAQINGCAAAPNGLWTCQLVCSGVTTSVLWAVTGTVSASALGASQMTDLNGNSSAVPANGSVSIGASPVLLQ